MDFAEKCNRIFWNTAQWYHQNDNIDFEPVNPFEEGTVEHTLFTKHWIDAVLWHLEEIIREPDIDPVEALSLKRRIDEANRERTGMVEKLDEHFRLLYKDVSPRHDATLNTETPASALDRLSILALKIYHMDVEVRRQDASPRHIEQCRSELRVLLEQREDLTTAISRLLDDIQAGRKYLKTYTHTKTYNMPNPALHIS